MNRFSSFTLFIVAAFVLVACAPQQPLLRPLYSGSEGIILSFPQSNSIRQFQDDTFTVSVRLENDGAASVSSDNPGFLLASFDPAILSFVSATTSSASGDRTALQRATVDAGCVPAAGVLPSSACAAFAARGRSQQSSVGDVVFGELTFKAKGLVDSRQQATTPLTVQACYPYTTTFIANICVDNDFQQNPSSSCNAVTLSAQPQGAPIAVTSVTPRYSRTDAGVMARYEITLKNLGTGLVIAPNSPSTEICNLDSINRLEYGVAKIAANLSTIPLDCGFDETETVRFVRNEAKIVCSYEGRTLPATMTETANYEAPLFITAQYYYIQRLTGQIEVIR